MKPELFDRHRQLQRSDLQPNNEFVIAQTTSVQLTSGRDFTLKVGDVIKIHQANSEGFQITINGHFKNRNDRPFIPLSDVGDFIIDNVE